MARGFVGVILVLNLGISESVYGNDLYCDHRDLCLLIILRLFVNK